MKIVHDMPHRFPKMTPIVADLLQSAEAGTLARANVDAYPSHTSVAMRLVWDGWLQLSTAPQKKGMIVLTDAGREWVSHVKDEALRLSPRAKAWLTKVRKQG